MSWLFGYEGRINRAKYCIAMLVYMIPYNVIVQIPAAMANHQHVTNDIRRHVGLAGC